MQELLDHIQELLNYKQKCKSNTENPMESTGIILKKKNGMTRNQHKNIYIYIYTQFPLIKSYMVRHGEIQPIQLLVLNLTRYV